MLGVLVVCWVFLVTIMWLSGISGQGDDSLVSQFWQHYESRTMQTRSLCIVPAQGLALDVARTLSRDHYGEMTTCALVPGGRMWEKSRMLFSSLCASPGLTWFPTPAISIKLGTQNYSIGTYMGAIWGRTSVLVPPYTATMSSRLWHIFK